MTGGFAGGAVTYIVQTPDTTVPNAQALSALASGIVLNTTTTGVLSTSLLVPATNFPALTGAITTPGGSLATTLTNAIVTLAKIQNATANSKLLGSGSAGSGSPYVELTLGSGLSMSGTTLSSTAAAVATGGGVGCIQYNTASAFDCSSSLIWTQGSTLLTVTGTTKTSTFLVGNNTPSLTSPENAVLALNQSWTGALGATANDGATIVTHWTPSASTSSIPSSLLVQALPSGSQPFTGTVFGVRSTMQSSTSSTIAQENAFRGEILDSGNSGTTSSAIAFEAVVAETNHTATSVFDFYAHGPFVHSGGVITQGAEYFGDDPLQNGCTTCASMALDFGARGRFQVAPSPAAATAFGYGSSSVFLNLFSTSNGDFVGSFDDMVRANLSFTPSADFGIGLGVIDGSTDIHATHNFTGFPVIGVFGDVSIDDGTGNFTDSGTGLNGLSGEIDFYGSGTVAEAASVNTWFGSGGGGVITNGQSIHVQAPYDTSSVVTNYIGLLLDNQTWPGSTTNYAILYNAPGGKKWGVFANGDVLFGGATMTFPAANAAGVLTNNGTGALSWSTTGLFPLRAPAGTSSAPSYSWSTATGVGLYEPSTNQTGIVGGVILGKTASAARGSILYVSGSGIAPSAAALEQIDLEPGLDTLQTLVVGQNGYGLYLNPTFSTSASGTNALVVNAYFDAGVWTNGGSTITEATTMYVAGAPSIGASKYAIHVAAGQVRLDGGAILKPTVFASVPVSPAVGTLWAISDSTTQTWGATVSGGGASFALINWDGANWVVFGK